MNEIQQQYWRRMIWIAIIALIAWALAGCFRIPVTVHPPSADDGQPIALPTAPTGTVHNADGTVDKLNPAFREPRPSDYPAQGGFDLGGIIQLALTLLGGGGLTGAFVMHRRARRAEQSEDEVYEDLKRAHKPTKENNNE